MLRPQDLLVLLRLALLEPDQRWTFQQLSHELGMSVSEVHAAAKRCAESRLIIHRQGGDRANLTNLFELVVHGVKYFFPPERGPITAGIPTAHAAPPLKDLLVDEDLPPVWPHMEGKERGEALQPIYRSAPEAALKNPKLYELLALVDAIRAGGARERKLAENELKKRWLQA